MLLASYTSTRPGIQGIANRLIRWRLDGLTSHSEIVFTPFDGVDDLMPDGSAAPDADGAHSETSGQSGAAANPAAASGQDINAGV